MPLSNAQRQANWRKRMKDRIEALEAEVLELRRLLLPLER